jgi:hypothetical protein
MIRIAMITSEMKREREIDQVIITVDRGRVTMMSRE